MLVRIESSDNNRIKLVRKLQNKKGRDSENKLVIEGINLVSEAIRRGINIDFVMVSDEFDGGQFLADIKADDEVLVCEIAALTFNKLTDADNGVGILAVIDKNAITSEDIAALPVESNVLILDRLQDPGNIGTMIRTAVATGYGLIVCIKGTADVFSPKVLRATAGMIFDIPIIYVSDAAELKNMMLRAGKQFVVTTVEGGRPYYEENLKTGIALVIGNEGNGVSDEILELADVRVTIPMKGDIESLNAAVSAAILMYEAVRE